MALFGSEAEWNSIIQKEEMVQLIEIYLKQATSDKKERNYLRKLLLEKETSFINYWVSGKEYYYQAIRDTVVLDLGGKTETLQRMKRFADFLHNNNRFSGAFLLLTFDGLLCEY